MEFLDLNFATLDVNLERQKQGKQELVVLVQTTAGIFKHLVSQELDNVLDSLRWDRRFLGPVDG